ncbi:Peptidase A1 domain-containing protein [Aphelenchoides besseyi]|nr:Peptidase A1 domain-containing protein [Aphelenchoides besseyi]
MFCRLTAILILWTSLVDETGKLLMHDVYSQSVSSRYDKTLYEAIISVGTPSQAFRILVGHLFFSFVSYCLGSNFLWIPKKGCSNVGRYSEYCATNQGVYIPELSNTSRDLNQKFDVTYGIGQTTGDIYEDKFAFGDPACKRQFKLKNPIIFGAASEILDGDQGVLGLGFSRSDQKMTSVFEQMIAESLVTEPIFTVVFRSCPDGEDECDHAGVLTLGEKPPYCGDVIGWNKLNRFALQWEFEMTAIHAGSYVEKLKQTDVITDSGASHILLPYKIIQEIVKAIGAKREESSYFISCKRRWKLHFEIGGIKYAVNSKELVSNLGNDRCELLIAERQYSPWILGDPFLRSYCVIHDFKNKRVGFARPQ